MEDTTSQTDLFNNEQRKPARVYQYVGALIATLGTFSLGTCLGWTSPVEIPLVKNKEYVFPISDSEFALIGSLMPLGALFATPVAGWMVTTLGRKTAILILCIPVIAGFAIMTWAQNVVMFYIGRVLSGIGTGGYTVAVPLYTSEYAETQIRGTLGSFFQLQLTLGTLFVYIVGAFVNVFWLTFICTVIPVVYGMLMVFMPESPIYYLEKNKVAEAKMSLQWFRGSGYNIEHEFQIMHQNIRQMLADKMTFFEAFSTKTAKKGLFLNIGLMVFQQFSGVNIVIFYTSTIFQNAGSVLSSNVETIITGAVAVVFTYASILVIDKLGRRPLLLFSGFVMAISTFFIGLYFFLQDRGENVNSFGWIPITFVCIFLFGFDVGFGPVPWIFLSEVFPRQISGYAVSVVCLFNFLCVFMVTGFFNFIQSLIGMGGSFFMFAVISAIGTVFAFFIIPETKNKTLEEILSELS